MTTLEAPAVAGTVHPRLAERLRDLNLFGALTEASSSRFFKYLMQPKLILRNGWLLDPNMELSQSDVRVYVLGTSTVVGQRLTIDRAQRQAVLSTFSPELNQEIRVDMESMQIIENRLSTPVSLN